jgi:putative SOS response-associated peptidase YedK
VCGRFSITGDLDFYAEYFGVDEIATKPLNPSWNVAPTDHIYVVADHDHARALGTMKWGLVPHWAKSSKNIHINARSETVASNPAFRDSFARKRCLIPSDGFYEWEPPETGRHPHWIFRADGHPMVFAGIWATRKDEATGEWVRSCSILTMGASGAISQIHDRMPLTLRREVWDMWLDRELTDPETALSLMQPIDDGLIMEYGVSKQVNSVRNNGPDLQKPEEPKTLF